MSDSLKTLNSSIELGTRSCLILTALDKKLGIDELVSLDYALIYSGEFGGPKNLHPAMPNHIAEIVHRREYLPKALNLFIKKGVITIEAKNSGYYYSSNARTLDFVSCLQTPYFKKAWLVLDWICENHSKVIHMPLTQVTERSS